MKPIIEMNRDEIIEMYDITDKIVSSYDYIAYTSEGDTKLFKKTGYMEHEEFNLKRIDLDVYERMHIGKMLYS